MPDSVVPPADSEMRAHVERVLTANYELDEEIGRGGMGVVYRAKDRRLKRTVAIKVLRPEIVYAGYELHRFEREGLAAAKLQGPHVVRIFDIDTSNLEGAARKMLGSRAHVQLLDRLYDASAGHQVAGRMRNHQVMVSLRAADKEFALNHECWHYAHEYFLTSGERRIVEEEFAPGTILNLQVRQLLQERGDLAAMRQCVDAKEAAAHGFALFVRGSLDVSEPTARGLFAQVWQAFRDIAAWLRSQSSERIEASDVFGIFEGVRRGDFAQAEPELVATAAPRG
mgnify:CR=1 FL=1